MPEFTAEQQSAIAYRRLDACVVAGPGSGKTTVLVERYRRLIEREGMSPQNILAITFTEKAAANMKSRLAVQFADNPERLRELERGWVSTIHGFCNRLLRENAIAAGLDPRFKMLDERESDDLRSVCMGAALDSMVALQREDALALIGSIQAPMFLAGQLKSVYDAILAAGRTITQVRSMPSPQGAEINAANLADILNGIVRSWGPNELGTLMRQQQKRDLQEWALRLSVADGASFDELRKLIADFPLDLRRVHPNGKEALRAFESLLQSLIASAVDVETSDSRALIFDVLQHFDELYRERKAEAGALDFNDLEQKAIELLSSDADIRTRVREQFRQVMLDEYQDVNEQQSVLVSLIRGEDRFFAVGDPNQSIYGFRHARPEIFRAYRDQIFTAGKHSAEILHNFRSREPVLRTVEAVLNSAAGIDPRELIATRLFHEKADPSIEVLRVLCSDKDEAADREARWIARRILDLEGSLPLSAKAGLRTARFSDIAILCRVGDAMQPILDALNDADIPYVCGRRQSFLSQREGLDIRAALYVVANPRDEISLATVLRSQLVGVSDEGLLRLRIQAGSLVSGLNLVAFERNRLAAFTPEDAAKLSAFMDNLKRWRAGQGIVPLDVLISRILIDSGFRWTPGTVTGDNVEEFLRLARARGVGAALIDFLAELESVEDAASKEAELSDEDQGNRVQVMTAHAAKGLEFPVVIIAAMDRDGRRGAPAVSFTPEFGVGIRWTDPADKDGLKDTWAKFNADRLKEREDEENNRLLYVAMTRAEEHLMLSYSAGGKQPGVWAKKVDELFQLRGQPPAPEPRLVTAAGVEATVRIVDTDPPPAVNSRATPELRVLVVDPPKISDQHDSTVNVTALTTFAVCPRRYYLQRYIGWGNGRAVRFDPEELPEREDAPEKTGAAELGTMVHEILAGKPGPWPDSALQLAEVFTRSKLGALAQSAARVEREWDFIAEVEEVMVRGTVDLWFEDAGSRVIVDYKTDAVSASEATARAAEYAPQLALYGVALGGSRAFLHFLRPDVVVEVPVDQAAQAQARDLIRQLRDAQNRLQFPLRTGEHCLSCSFYRGMCPAGSAPELRSDEPEGAIDAE